MPGGTPNGNGLPNGNGHSMTNGAHMSNGAGQQNGRALPNGHRPTNGSGNSAQSSGGYSSGGASNSRSPPPIEQKRLLHELTPPGTRTGPSPGRRSTLGSVPDLQPGNLATHWNPNGVEPAFEQQHRVSRRNSNVPAFSNSPRAASPEQRRAYSPGPAYGRNSMGAPSVLRSGAMSPVSTLRNETIRSASPLRSEITSPSGPMSPVSAIQRNESPARGVGNIARNGNAFAAQQEAAQAAQQHSAALAALQGQTPQPALQSSQSHPQLNGSNGKHLGPSPHSQKPEKKRLSLITQLPSQQPASVPEEEEMETVISMSPAVREPIMSFRRSRSSLALSAMGMSAVGGSSSQVNLSGMSLSGDEGKRRTYFGQSVDARDLVASGIENAFTRL